MTNLIRWLGRGGSRSSSTLGYQDWVDYFGFGNLQYPLTPQTTLGQTAEEIAGSFMGYAEQAYKQNGVIFACMCVRMLLFSEARFQFRQIRQGRPGDLFGTTELKILEEPWVNGTTGDLLSRMIQDADLAGNFYGARPIIKGDGNRIQRLRPDWVSILMGSESSDKNPNWQRDAQVIGYLYHPGGLGSGQRPETLLPEEVVHFAPIPDPTARFRGMSWITPVVREIMGDSAANTHKLKFFENGATPNLVVSLAPDVTPEVFKEWIEIFEEDHEGYLNAYRTMYLGGGADVKVVGADMKQIDFKTTQGAGETRIAAAAQTPPILVGLSEGLEASTYSNYLHARRRFADATMRPLWRNAAGSLSRIIKVPSDAELWYDDRDIPFLAEDVKDAAVVQQNKAATIKTLMDSGFEADSVIKAVTSDDLRLLKHTGFLTVQLQKPGEPPPGSAAPKSAGNGGQKALPAPKKSPPK